MVQTSRKFKYSATAGFSFLGIMSALIGIPGMVDDLAGWQEWIAKAREVIPWGWAMLAAIGSLSGAVVPWIPWMPWNRPGPAGTTSALVEPARREVEEPSPRPPPTQTDRFRDLESEMVAVGKYMRDDDLPYSVDMEGRVYALKDKLNKLNIRMPDSWEGRAELLGFMKTGNLKKAQLRFPDLLF